MVRSMLDSSYRTARRAAIALVGFGVLAGGVAMLLLPGPAILVIPAGLAILGLEFAWARRCVSATWALPPSPSRPLSRPACA